MARYEHLPIYRAAFDLAVHVETREASPAELERARKSLSLIAARGYHRGRDLAQEIGRLSDRNDDSCMLRQ